MENNVVVLALLVLVATATARKCSDNFKAFLVMQDNEIGEEISDMCLEEFDGKSSEFDCQSFKNSGFNRSFLPSSVRYGPSVSKPSKLVLLPFQYQRKFDSRNYLVSGLNVSWESPTSDLARKKGQGFIFYYHAFDNRTETNGCRLLHLNSSKTYREGKWFKVRFSYVLRYVAYNATIHTKIYTVPTPGTPDQLEEMVKEGDIRTTHLIDLDDKDFSPGNWYPSVGLTPGKRGNLTLRLSLSPPAINLTTFTLMLIKRSYDESNYFGTPVVFQTQVAGPDKNTDEYTFESLEADEYRVVVRPWDTFNRVEGKCLCWEAEGTGRHCKLNCADVQTPWVQLTDGCEGSSLITTPTDHSSPATHRAEELQAPGTDAALIAGSVVGTLLAGIILAFGFVFFLFRHKPCVKDKISCIMRKTPVDWTSMSPRAVSGSDPPVCLSDKTVYFLYSDDSEAHAEFTDALATFLNVHCRCRVIYRQWCKLSPDQDGLSWVVSNINAADLVLFVASQGAQLLLEAEMSKHVYSGRHIGPEGDLFTMGVQALRFMSGEGGLFPAGRVLAVHTGTTRWCQQLLLLPVMYQLPIHLPDVLQKIHQLSPTEAKTLKSELPLSLSLLPNLPEGKQLLSAIAATEKYERDEPTWFKDKFGPAVPIVMQMQSQVSNTDSDYGSLVLSKSVSSQDLSCYNQAATSPASVLSSPDFPQSTGTTSHKNKDLGSSLAASDIATPSIFTIRTELDPLRGMKAADGIIVPVSVDRYSHVKPREVVSAVGTEMMSVFLKDVNSSSAWASVPAVPNCFASISIDNSHPASLPTHPHHPASLVTVPKNTNSHHVDFLSPGSLGEKNSQNLWKNLDVQGQNCCSIESPIPSVTSDSPAGHKSRNTSCIKPPEAIGETTSDCLSLAFQQVNCQYTADVDHMAEELDTISV